MSTRSRDAVRVAVACAGVMALLVTNGCGGGSSPVAPGGGGGGGGGTGALTASFTAQNTPCVAPATGPVTCTFAGTATGSTAPYTYSWRFTSPTNTVVTATTQNAQPVLECGFSAGVVTFQLGIALTVTSTPTGTTTTVTGNQQIARAAGACGT